MKHLYRLFLVTLISVCLSTITAAKDAGSFRTTSFSEIEDLVANLVPTIDPAELLIVWDIDNTLLRLDDDFGSEQWFNWQKGLIESGLVQLPAVTNTPQNLLTVQSWIYQARPMHLVDQRQAPWNWKLRSLGSSVIALTSRVIEVRDPTLREIAANRIPLSGPADLGLPLSPQPYLPYDIRYPETSGLTRADLQRFKLNEARPVLFADGVFFTQGQHKGVMLKTLLHRLSRAYKYVLFIDDRPHHVEGMRAAAATMSPEIFSVHYNLSEQWTTPFLEGDKTTVEAQWCEFTRQLERDHFSGREGVVFNRCL